MNRAARMSINAVVFAAGAIVALAAQIPTSNMSDKTLSQDKLKMQSAQNVSSMFRP